MFDQLFKRPRALARHRGGPLRQERLRYLAHLADQGMTRTTLREAAVFLLIVAEHLRLSERPGEIILLSEIQQKAALWGDRPGKSALRKDGRRSRERFLDHATQFLRFLGRLQLPPSRPHPFADRVAAYADHMRHQQGLSPDTITQRCGVVEKFLEQLDMPGHCLSEVTPRRIDDALVRRVTEGGYARVTVQDLACSLRAFFRFAQAQGWCRRGLAEAIQAPRVFSQETLPAGPSWQDVKRLLATTEGDDPTAIRDRAIVLLFAVYGFRVGEVIRLRLEDFDWQRELLSLTRLKTRRAQVFPLSRTVGDAVLRYLREVRPRSPFREIFLPLHAPIRPLSRGALGSVVRRRLRALGLSLAHYGPHALRHACATHLLSEGLALKEIGDHLGHVHPDATRVYAKVDLLGLRQVADFDLGGLR